MSKTAHLRLTMLVPASMFVALSGAQVQNSPADVPAAMSGPQAHTAAPATGTADSPSANPPAVTGAIAVAGQQQEAAPIQTVQQVSSLEDEMLGGID